ncbi:MAG: hypothetical protein M1816_005925 [Peltula sp. TS41687]|nr:MAG: hypothetical protein M1816_005925 [Peltula sp. TS41687]
MHIHQVEQIIGYTFKNTSYLVQALTAAGADEQNYDGNRPMAQLGESLIETVILDNAFTAGATRDPSMVLLNKATHQSNSPPTPLDEEASFFRHWVMEQTPGSPNSRDAALPLAEHSFGAEGFDTSPSAGCNDAPLQKIMECDMADMADSAEHANHSETPNEAILFEAPTNSPSQSQTVDADDMSVNDTAADTDSAPANSRSTGSSLPAGTSLAIMELPGAVWYHEKETYCAKELAEKR